MTHRYLENLPIHTRAEVAPVIAITLRYICLMVVISLKKIKEKKPSSDKSGKSAEHSNNLYSSGFFRGTPAANEGKIYGFLSIEVREIKGETANRAKKYREKNTQPQHAQYRPKKKRGNAFVQVLSERERERGETHWAGCMCVYVAFYMAAA